MTKFYVKAEIFLNIRNNYAKGGKELAKNKRIIIAMYVGCGCGCSCSYKICLCVPLCVHNLKMKIKNNHISILTYNTHYLCIAWSNLFQ